MPRTNILAALWAVPSLLWLAAGFAALDIGGRFDRIDPAVAPPAVSETLDEAFESAREQRREEAWIAVMLWLGPPIALPVLIVGFAAHKRRRHQKREIEREPDRIRENGP